MRATAGCLIVVVTICSWLAISNHCAIRALTTKAETKQGACPFHSKPAKPQSNQTECCKILRALANAPVKLPTRVIVDLPKVDLASTDLTIFVAPTVSFAPATLGTGPPGKTSFLELNRSLRAHAPPFLA